MATGSRYLIIGLNRFGQELARALHRDGHEITIVDSDGERVDACRDFVRHAIVADPTRLDILKQLDAAEMKAVLLTIPDSEPALLVALALSTLGVSRLIVEVDSTQAAVACEMMGIDEVIDPLRLAADTLARRLSSRVGD